MLPDALCNSLSLSRSLARSLIYPCVFAFRSCHHVPIPTAVLLASRLAYLFFLFPKRVNELASGWVRGPFVHPLAAVHSLTHSLSLLISHTLPSTMPWFPRYLVKAAAVVLLATVTLMIYNTLTLTSLQPASASEHVSFPPFVRQPDEMIRVLQQAVQLPTISADRSEAESAVPLDPETMAAFESLHQLLERSFPLVHATLQREKVNGLSLLYTWKGTAGSVTLWPMPFGRLF